MNIDDIRINITRNQIDPSISRYTFNKWYDELDLYDKYITGIHIKIYRVDEEGDELDVVGYGDGFFFESGFTWDDDVISFYDLCDMVSQSLCEMADEIVDNDGWIKETICEPHENLLHLDRIYIKPKYRNFGIGKYVISFMGELLGYTYRLFPHVITLNPCPLEEQNGSLETIKDDKEYEVKKEQLVKFYKSCGFEKISNKDHMFRKLDM